MDDTPQTHLLPPMPGDTADSAFPAGLARAALLRAIAELAEPNADGNRVQTIRTLAQSLAQLTENDHDQHTGKILHRLEAAEKRIDDLEKTIPPVPAALVADALREKFSGGGPAAKPARKRLRKPAEKSA